MTETPAKEDDRCAGRFCGHERRHHRDRDGATAQCNHPDCFASADLHCQWFAEPGEPQKTDEPRPEVVEAVEAVLRVTRTMEGEAIPVLIAWLDPRCLSWTVALDQPTRPHLKHVEGCACGQVPITVRAIQDGINAMHSSLDSMTYDIGRDQERP